MMELPPGSLALFLILSFWSLITVLGILLLIFPGMGMKRSHKAKSESRASRSTV